MAARSTGHVLEFFYDISCPFAYIASTRIEALAARTGAKLIWRPVLLGAIYRATNAPQGAAGSASDVFNPTKKKISSQAFDRTLQRYGIPHKTPPNHPVKTTAALRLLYYVDDAQRPALSKELFRAYWVKRQNVSEPETLVAAVRTAGVTNSDSVIKAIESGDFEGSEQREKLETATNDAVQRGSPGVPGFWVADEVWTDKDGQQHTGRLYWGQDRMHFVEAVLESLNEGRKGRDLHLIRKPLQDLVPRCISRDTKNKKQIRLEFWYDFSSPWAFLGWTQLERLRRQYGDLLQIEMKPFVLGILFREIGAPNLPSGALSEQKRKYANLDHSDWVRWWNAVNKQEGSRDKNIDFYWADKFPIRSPELLRVALVEPTLVDVIFRACWERNLDVSSTETLKAVIDEAGYDGAFLIEQANGYKVKQQLRLRTQRAMKLGLCGVPSYRVFRKHRGQGEREWKPVGGIVWGQDELVTVEDMMHGWKGQDVAEVRLTDRARSKL